MDSNPVKNPMVQVGPVEIQQGAIKRFGSANPFCTIINNLHFITHTEEYYINDIFYIPGHRIDIGFQGPVVHLQDQNLFPHIFCLIVNALNS